MKQKLSVYLVENKETPLEYIINTEKVHESIYIESDANMELILYSVKGDPHLPPWADFFIRSVENIPDKFFGDSSSSGAILVVSRNDNVFLITFGTGHLLVNSNSVVKNFGLKVTLNSIEVDKIKSIDKGNYNELSLLTRNQCSKDADINVLKVDAELDIISTMTGSCREEIFGSKITGRAALYIHPCVDINNLSEILDKSIEKYKEKLPYEFEWIENIYPADNECTAMLDELLEENLKSENLEDIWMADPEIIDHESIVAYGFEQKRNSPAYPSLCPTHLISLLKEKKPVDYIKYLKDKSIFALDGNYHAHKKWPIYDFIYTEIEDNGQTYILRSGTWYSIKQSFMSSVDSELEGLIDSSKEFGFPLYSFDKEEDYIKYACSKDSTLTLMDQVFIYHGGSGNKIEFCDVIKDENKFIHIKYYRGSQSMSHLFAQGAVCAELFLGDKEFRRKLNVKLPEHLKLSNTNERPPGKYELVYAIAANKKIPSELPIFAKINLKNFRKRLLTLGYDVKLCKIDIDANIYKKKSYRGTKDK
ncbi:TIGR04141 family sporadically distributed protein [Zymobacter sp. IVIA_12111.31 C1]|uniref:TIGR04141 family sporadically distributed protein n=1 Tax=Zymobacter sp. IVIA_12111.31 C1 TaxID=3394854 RepID=UPI0039C1AA5E